MSPLSFSIFSIGYSAAVCGQEVQDIVLGNPRSRWVDTLPIGWSMIVGVYALRFDGGLTPEDVRLMQIVVGTLLVGIRFVSLMYTASSGSVKCI